MSRRPVSSRYHVSLLMFLMALGLVPVSLDTSSVSAETEQGASSEVKTLDQRAIAKAPEAKEVVENESVEATEITPILEVAESQTEVWVSEPVENSLAVETKTPETTRSHTAVKPADQIRIAGNVVPIFRSSNTLIDAGSQAGLYGRYFIYGHNTYNVFGGLSSLGVGARFTVTLDGTTKTYQVMGSDLQKKSYFEGYEETAARVEGAEVSSRNAVKMMKAMTAYGRYRGNYYDYILMTCAGTSYGNGDASHRLVLLANEV